MKEIVLLIYTHSECSFIWPALIDLVNKNINNLEIHFACNDTLTITNEYNIPNNWIIHTYSDTDVWTKRVNKVLNEINSDYILFIHEDWLPTDNVNNDNLNEIVNFMRSNNIDYVLSYSHKSVVESQEGIPTKNSEYFLFKEFSHIFQPAIWKNKTFKEFSDKLNKTKVENEDADCLFFMSNKQCYSVQNINTVNTLRTTNSYIFPHMHALSQNQWNFTKYPHLKNLMESYKIETNSRGVHTWWELDTQ